MSYSFDILEVGKLYRTVEHRVAFLVSPEFTREDFVDSKFDRTRIRRRLDKDELFLVVKHVGMCNSGVNLYHVLIKDTVYGLILTGISSRKAFEALT